MVSIVTCSSKRSRSPRMISGLIMAIALIGMSAGGEGRILGVPGEYPSIQTAVDSAGAGDTVLVAPGLYEETVDTGDKWIALISQSGPNNTEIDGGQSGTVVSLRAGGVVSGFTLRNGKGTGGGGISLDGTEGAVVTNNIIQGCSAQDGGGIYMGFGHVGTHVAGNVIEENTAFHSGGGIYDYGGSFPRNMITDNTFRGNMAGVCGGGAYVAGTHLAGNLFEMNHAQFFGGGVCGAGAEIVGNTIVKNSTANSFMNGVGIDITDGRGGKIQHNIVAMNFTTSGNAGAIGIACGLAASDHEVSCNDSWGHSGGQFLVAECCDTTGLGNFSLDPRFCNAEGGDYGLAGDSPCRPETACGLFGAFEVVCEGTPTNQLSWGQLKSLYR